MDFFIFLSLKWSSSLLNICSISSGKSISLSKSYPVPIPHSSCMVVNHSILAPLLLAYDPGQIYGVAIKSGCITIIIFWQTEPHLLLLLAYAKSVDLCSENQTYKSPEAMNTDVCAGMEIALMNHCHYSVQPTIFKRDLNNKIIKSYVYQHSNCFWYSSSSVPFLS